MRAKGFLLVVITLLMLAGCAKSAEDKLYDYELCMLKIEKTDYSALALETAIESGYPLASQYPSVVLSFEQDLISQAKKECEGLLD